MSIVVQGVIHGRTIQLKEHPDVADGQEVEVVVRVLDPLRKWGDGILRSAGACADVEGFDEAFEEVQWERKSAKFRDDEK